MSSTAPFGTGFKTTPYWWDAMSPIDVSASTQPFKADVVIIGGGLTGSSAAATLARAGRDVVVIEKEYPGYGASARGAGFLSRHFKHSLTDLLKKFDEPVALSYLQALSRIYDDTLNLIKTENLPCGLQENGQFIAAMSESDFDVLKHEYALRKKYLNTEFQVIDDGGTTEYRSQKVVGGILLRKQGSIHPGLYAQAMASRAVSSGATLLCNTSALGVRRSDDSFVVTTSKGEIRCKDVIIATNGYSDKSIKWVRRRLIPIRGYMVTTEPLPEGLMTEILPNNRTYTDRRKASNYLRPTPDGTRLIFGGQTGAALENDVETAARRVYQEMIEMFPQLRGIKLSHAWTGRCAATMDMIPKVGKKDGMYFALAYCFSGNVLAPYLGKQVAKRILGQETVETPFEARQFRAIPFYNGNPWFVPIVQKYYETVDRLRRV